MSKTKFSSDDTFNIILDYSPRNSFNGKVFSAMENLSNTDLVLSGHLHDGCVPKFMNFIPGNHGIITPYMELFGDNCRGEKQITDSTYGIIFPAICQFDHHQGILKRTNFMFKPETQKIFIKSVK